MKMNLTLHEVSIKINSQFRLFRLAAFTGVSATNGAGPLLHMKAFWDELEFEHKEYPDCPDCGGKYVPTPQSFDKCLFCKREMETTSTVSNSKPAELSMDVVREAIKLLDSDYDPPIRVEHHGLDEFFRLLPNIDEESVLAELYGIPVRVNRLMPWGAIQVIGRSGKIIKSLIVSTPDEESS